MHRNPKQTFTNQPESSGSQATRSTPRNLELATYARPNRDESLYQLMTIPFNPDPCLYPPPMSMADQSHSNYSSFLPVAPSESHDHSLPTSDIIPPGCYEEFITHERGKKPDFVKWGGPIDFAPVKMPSNVFSTPLRHCLAGFGVYNPEERLFQKWAEAGKTHVHFKIMWPAYPQLNWVVPLSIFGSDSLLVTKREFAHRIAVQYQNLVVMCESNQLVCHDPRWRIGRGAYTLDRMKLSMLHWVEGDIWQAYIIVLTDRDLDPTGVRPMKDLAQSGSRFTG